MVDGWGLAFVCTFVIAFFSIVEERTGIRDRL